MKRGLFEEVIFVDTVDYIRIGVHGEFDFSELSQRNNTSAVQEIKQKVIAKLGSYLMRWK